MKVRLGRTKYGPEGLYNSSSFENLNLPEEVRQTLATTANQAICVKSWSSYRTAISMLDRCLSEFGEEFTLPLTDRLTSLFVGWLLQRNLSVSTIRAYLSGVRTLHITRGGGGKPLIFTHEINGFYIAIHASNDPHHRGAGRHSRPWYWAP